MQVMGAPFLVQQAARAQDYGVGKMTNEIAEQTRSHLSLETNFPFVQSVQLECAAQLVVVVLCVVHWTHHPRTGSSLETNFPFVQGGQLECRSIMVEYCCRALL